MFWWDTNKVVFTEFQFARLITSTGEVNIDANQEKHSNPNNLLLNFSNLRYFMSTIIYFFVFDQKSGFSITKRTKYIGNSLWLFHYFEVDVKKSFQLVDEYILLQKMPSFYFYKKKNDFRAEIVLID